jgi:enoyl-CoA hydratase
MAGVSVQRDGAVGVCRLQRPEQRNALTAELLGELAGCLDELEADSEVGALVLTGTDDVFASGWDVAALADPDAGFELAPRPEQWHRLARLRKPLVAAVSGWALGGGFELALSCDLVVACEHSRFGLPEVTVGLVPGGGAAARLAAVLGRQRAMELVLTGGRIEAPRAQELGLVNLTVKHGRYRQAAGELAAELARRSPAANRLAKLAVLEGLEPGAEAMARAHELAERAFASPEREEAMRALREGHSPRFR